MKLVMTLILSTSFFLNSCATLPKGSRQPQSTADESKTLIERMPIVVSEARSVALVRTVTNRRQLRFQECRLSPEDMTSNKAVVDSVNKFDSSCSDINKTAFEIDNAQAVTALNGSYESRLKELLRTERRISRLMLKYADYSLQVGIASTVSGAMLMAYGLRVQGYRGAAVAGIGAVAAGVGIAVSLLTLMAKSTELNDYMMQKAETLETNLQSLVAQKKIVGSDDTWPTKLYQSIIEAIDSSSRVVFEQFYST